MFAFVEHCTTPTSPIMKKYTSVCCFFMLFFSHALSQPSTFRPVARRPHRHFVFHLPVLNLLLPGMLCIIAVHHMLCKSRHPQQQPLSLGSFSSFASRNPCPEGLCLSS